MGIRQRILVIKHGALGDLMQAEGAMKDIRLAYPKAFIALLTSPTFGKLMQRCPHVDAVILDSRPAFWRLAPLITLYRRLMSYRFDIVIDLQNSRRTSFYRQWIFNKAQWMGRLPDAPQPASGFMGLQSIIAQHMKPHYVAQPNLTWMVEDVTSLLDAQAVKRPYILCFPGSSAAHGEKRWPHYGPLITRLMALGYEVVSVLGPDEVTLAQHLPGKVLTSLNWFMLAGVIHQSAYVIGNDTGPCHIACGLNKTGLAIFGPTTSAERSALARGTFKTVECKDLQALSVEAVLSEVLPTLHSIFNQ
jgi:ADP-heptose:LPS heptosyltransferase